MILEKPSITEFCEMPENQNQLFYWIGDRNPEDFKFIGFLENSRASIVKCASALGWSHVPNFPWINKKIRANKLDISQKETDFIKSKNYEELRSGLKKPEEFWLTVTQRSVEIAKI